MNVVLRIVVGMALDGGLINRSERKPQPLMMDTDVMVLTDDTSRR